MKIRSKKSEYQQCFSPPDKDYFTNVYAEQLTYRMKRREKEHCHYVMRWDSESSEENNESNEEKFQEKGSGDNAQDVEQLEESKSVNDGNKSIATYTKEPEGKESDTTSIIKSVATYAKEPECKESNTIYISVENEEETKHTCAKSHNLKLPSFDQSKEKPPFLSYGWADERIESGRKKTHNIRAPKTTVYPAALQRLNYLKQEKIKQKQKNERRAASATSIPLYQKPTDTSSWQSEYQRCYSSQSNRPTSAPPQRKRETKSRKGFRSAMKPPR